MAAGLPQIERAYMRTVVILLTMVLSKGIVMAQATFCKPELLRGYSRYADELMCDDDDGSICTMPVDVFRYVRSIPTRKFRCQKGEWVFTDDCTEFMNKREGTGCYCNTTHFSCDGADYGIVPFPLNTNLQYLMLRHAEITRLTGGSFAYGLSLRHMDLSHNFIALIEVNTFDGLVELRSLNMSQNQLQRLPVGSFPSEEKLISLDVSNNMIMSIDPHVIDGTFPVKRDNQDVGCQPGNIEFVMESNPVVCDIKQYAANLTTDVCLRTVLQCPVAAIASPYLVDNMSLACNILSPEVASSETVGPLQYCNGVVDCLESSGFSLDEVRCRGNLQLLDMVTLTPSSFNVCDVIKSCLKEMTFVIQHGQLIARAARQFCDFYRINLRLFLRPAVSKVASTIALSPENIRRYGQFHVKKTRAGDQTQLDYEGSALFVRNSVGMNLNITIQLNGVSFHDQCHATATAQYDSEGVQSTTPATTAVAPSSSQDASISLAYIIIAVVAGFVVFVVLLLLLKHKREKLKSSLHEQHVAAGMENLMKESMLSLKSQFTKIDVTEIPDRLFLHA